MEALADIAAAGPEAPESGCQALFRSGIGEHARPLEGDSEVVVIGVELVEPGIGPVSRRLGPGPLGERQIPREMSVRELDCADVVGELFGAVLADRLVHPEAVAGAVEEALVDERYEVVEVGPADVFDRLEGRAAREDGEAREQLLLGRAEEIVRTTRSSRGASVVGGRGRDLRRTGRVGVRAVRAGGRARGLGPVPLRARLPAASRPVAGRALRRPELAPMPFVRSRAG